jgi:hypothetical protein
MSAFSAREAYYSNRYSNAVPLQLSALVASDSSASVSGCASKRSAACASNSGSASVAIVWRRALNPTDGNSATSSKGRHSRRMKLERRRGAPSGAVKTRAPGMVTSEQIAEAQKLAAEYIEKYKAKSLSDD